MGFNTSKNSINKEYHQYALWASNVENASMSCHRHAGLLLNVPTHYLGYRWIVISSIVSNYTGAISQKKIKSSISYPSLVFYPYLAIDCLLYFKGRIYIFTAHRYKPLCRIISSLTCSALGCLMNMWTFKPSARWAHGLLWWSRTAINNVVFYLVKSSSLFLYCLS